MIITKTTVGFVVQTFDTEKKQFVRQEFIAGETVDWEDPAGNSIKPPVKIAEPYLEFDMVQPHAKGEHVFNDVTKHCVHCGCDEDDAFCGGELCSDGKGSN
jgi:hypothetical protein